MKFEDKSLQFQVNQQFSIDDLMHGIVQRTDMPLGSFGLMCETKWCDSYRRVGEYASRAGDVVFTVRPRLRGGGKRGRGHDKDTTIGAMQTDLLQKISIIRTTAQTAPDFNFDDILGMCKEFLSDDTGGIFDEYVAKLDRRQLTKLMTVSSNNDDFYFRSITRMVFHEAVGNMTAVADNTRAAIDIVEGAVRIMYAKKYMESTGRFAHTTFLKDIAKVVEQKVEQDSESQKLGRASGAFPMFWECSQCVLGMFPVCVGNVPSGLWDFLPCFYSRAKDSQ